MQCCNTFYICTSLARAENGHEWWRLRHAGRVHPLLSQRWRNFAIAKRLRLVNLTREDGRWHCHGYCHRPCCGHRHSFNRPSSSPPPPTASSTSADVSSSSISDRPPPDTPHLDARQRTHVRSTAQSAAVRAAAVALHHRIASNRDQQFPHHNRQHV